MNSARVVLALLCTCTTFAIAVEPPLDVDQVATAFAIPATSVRRTLKTEEVAVKYGGSIHSASLFEFESEPNVTMQVIVTKGHVLLTDALRGRLEGEPAVMEKVDLENAGEAYIGIEGAGPGAEGYVAIAHLPSHDLDFRLRVMLSNDGLTSSEASPTSSLRSSLLLKQALRTLAISSSRKLAQMVVPVSASTTKGTLPVEPARNSGLDGQVDQKSTTGQSLQPTQAKPKSPSWKLYALAIFTLGLVATYWLWRKRNIKSPRFGKLGKLTAFSLIILTTGTGLVVARRFRPPNHLEFTSAKGNHRLIAVAVDSADGTILVKACDWPHTFFSPSDLGDAAWPEKYASANCYWSKDGTLVVWETQGVNDKMKQYEAAYDFREHLSIDAQTYAGNTQACNKAIAALVAERGGLASTAIDIPPLNSGLYQK